MKKIEAEAKIFLKERGWDKLRPSDLAKSISIEAAELLELFQWSSLTIKQTKNDKDKLEHLKNELADVFLYAFYLSISLGLDTEKIILDKLAKVSAKYPPAIVKRQKGKQPGTEDFYVAIKKKHRVRDNR